MPSRPLPKVIEFRGEPARILWANIKDHLGLSEAAKAQMASDDDADRRRGVASMVSFMMTCAWGYQKRTAKYARNGALLYDSLEGRLAYLLSLNSAIYRLSWSRRPVELHVFLDEYEHMPPIELGHYDGFSAVLPLTERGYLAYNVGGVPISELMNEHIVREPHAPRSVEYLAITGLVDCKALPEYLSPDNSKNQFPRRARRLLNELASQILFFASSINVYKDQHDIIYCEGVDGHQRPLLFSPLSGRGMGEDILETAGFRPLGLDERRNVIWQLDFEELNGRRVDPERLKQILRSAHFVARNLPSPVEGTAFTN
jgi:cation transport regulator ChaB